MSFPTWWQLCFLFTKCIRRFTLESTRAFSSWHPLRLGLCTWVDPGYMIWAHFSIWKGLRLMAHLTTSFYGKHFHFHSSIDSIVWQRNRNEKKSFFSTFASYIFAVFFFFFIEGWKSLSTLNSRALKNRDGIHHLSFSDWFALEVIGSQNK